MERRNRGIQVSKVPVATRRSRERQRDPLAKGFQLLARMIALGPGEHGVRKLADELELPPSSVHRLLTILEPLGMVRRGTDGSYGLGLEFYRMAWQATSTFPLRVLAQPVLEELGRESSEGAFLGLYDRTRREMFFAIAVQPRHRLQYRVELDEWVPIHAGASGLAILAFLPHEERLAVARQTGLQAQTPNTIRDVESLEREVRATRARGYAVSRGQRTEGAVGIAAPIWNADSQVIGDVLVSLPETRYRPQMERGLADLVLVAASRLTALIGGRLPEAG